MDHADVRERLELAAVEPGGLDRLMAGDTAESAAVAAHLVGCDACADELRRLHAAAALIRDVVRSTPPADLRARTLSYVETLGRRREPAPAGAEVPSPAPADAVPEPVAAGSSPESRIRREAATARWIAALAAALIVAVAGTALVVGAQRDAAVAQRDAELADRADDVAALERVAAAGLRVAGEPDAVQVALAATGASGVEDAAGTLAFTPSTRELVVIARGLPRPPDGREFRCWVESDGERRAVGRMYFADELAFWVGEVDAVAELRPGSRFGVTLVDRAGDALDGDPALLGEL